MVHVVEREEAFHRDLVGRALDPEYQVRAVAADGEVCRRDPGLELQHVRRSRIVPLQVRALRVRVSVRVGLVAPLVHQVVAQGVLPVATPEQIGVAAATTAQRIVACATVQRVIARGTDNACAGNPSPADGNAGHDRGIAQSRAIGELDPVHTVFMVHIVEGEETLHCHHIGRALDPEDQVRPVAIDVQV